MSPIARDRARAKRRYAKRQAKLAQRAHARRTQQQVIAAVVAVVVVIGGVFAVAKLTGDSSTKKPPAASNPTTPAAGACPTATAAKVAKPQQFKAAPAQSLAEDRTWTATVVTTCGTMTFSLDGKKAPQTVASFNYLAGKGYFNNTTCHRLTTKTPLYVLQCGDPTASGGGGPGYGFGIENAPASGKYPAGTIAMARSDDPKSNGSQFFIVYQDSTITSDSGYSIFGAVKTGLDVVTKVATGGVTGGSTDGAPATPINITSVTVK